MGSSLDIATGESPVQGFRSHRHLGRKGGTQAPQGCIALGSLDQLSSLNPSAPSTSANAPSAGGDQPSGWPNANLANQPGAYPLALAAIQAALGLISRERCNFEPLFRADQHRQIAGPATSCSPYSARTSHCVGNGRISATAALNQRAPRANALTLSAPIA